MPGRTSRPVGNDQGAPVRDRIHTDIQRFPGLIVVRHVRREPLCGAQQRHRQLGVEHELGAPEGVGARLAIRAVGIEHQYVHTRQRSARAAVPNGDAGRHALRYRRPGRRQDYAQLAFPHRLEHRPLAGERESLVLDDGDALTAALDEVLAAAGPGTSPTGHWPNRDASSSLRVNWLVRRSSVVMPLHSPPGEYSSSRSSNMNRRIRDPDNRVVAMHHRVDHRLEDGALAELRHVRPRGSLYAPTRRLRTTKCTASRICPSSGPAMSLASTCWAASIRSPR